MNDKVPLNEKLLSQTTRNQGLKKFVRWAIIFHIVVIIVGMIGLPHWRQPIDLSKAVSVDLVAPNAAVSAAPNKTKVAKPPNPVKPPDAPKPPQAQNKPPTPAASDDTKKDDTPKPDQTEKTKPKTETPKKDATKSADNKINLNKKKDKDKKKTENNPQDQKQFNSLLKNLLADDKAQPDQAADAPVDDATKESGSAPVTSEKLSLSDMDALKYQLAKCWNIPSGAMNAEDLIVDIRVEVNPDRTVKTAEIVDTGRYQSDSFFAAAADSARRALFNPQCTPLALPEEKYDVWKTLLIRFNPKDMFGG